MNKLCECPIAGWCARHKVEKNLREHQICSGKNCTATTSKKYWDAWEFGSLPGQSGPVEKPKEFKEGVSRASFSIREHQRMRVTPSSIIGGVGTELKLIFNWFGQYQEVGCKCAKYALIMDRKGIPWCEAHVSTIVGWIHEEANKRKVKIVFDLEVTLGTIPGFDLGVEALVWQAISNAKKKLTPGIISPSQIRNMKYPPLIGEPIDRDKLTSHILYHVMPLAGESEWVWRRHVQWIREVRPRFNGRLVVGIVTPGPGDIFSYCDPEAVKESFRGLDAEFIEAPNDVHSDKNPRRGLGEGTLFIPMLERLHTDDPNQIAVYGHCKGVTRPVPEDGSPHHWAKAMFDTTFRNLEEMVDALDWHGAAGSFVVRDGSGVGRPGPGKWFFSGTFFGVRLIDVFRRSWRELARHYGCVEQWPQRLFRIDSEAVCLFRDNSGNLYDDNLWKTIDAELEEWRKL